MESIDNEMMGENEFIVKKYDLRSKKILYIGNNDDAVNIEMDQI